MFKLRKYTVERGFKVLIRDPPPSGSLKVYGLSPIIGWITEWVPIETYSVTSETTELLIPAKAYPKYKFELYDDSYLLYSKEVDAPEKGIVGVKLYGWFGCHWRTTIVEAPDKVRSGERFKLKARLFKTPDIPAGKGLPVVFYRKVGEEEKSIGSNFTDENGYAVITTSETLPEGKEELEVEYYAVYEYEDTYAEPVVVTVVSEEAPTNAWEQFVSLIKQFLESMGIEVTMEQANAIAMGIVGFVALSFLSSLLR